MPFRRPRFASTVRVLVSRWKLVALVLFAAALEIVFHVRSFAIIHPSGNLDAPFRSGCQDGVQNITARANATFMMLARNSDVNGAVASIESVQRQFNDHFDYPWVFLNDEPWTPEFIVKVTNTVGQGSKVHFDTISKDMWGYPAWIDQQRAKKSMNDAQTQGIIYVSLPVRVGTIPSPILVESSQAGMAETHLSSFFYDHPALQPHRWYWRVEPDIKITCQLTYDPFVSMAAHQKVYGYTLTLWELGKTVPSLFRKLSDYKKNLHVPTTTLWTALIDPSWMPWPIRRFLLPLLRNRNAEGDLWNMCHFWSNFEIADMNFFRSEAYRNLVRYLDEDGGFYYERWGDAPVHTLAAAILLKPEQLHHFSDVGYVHGGLQYCAFAPTEEALSRGVLVPRRKEDQGKMLGCNCECDEQVELVDPTCFNRLRRTVM